MQEYILETENLTKRFRSVTAVDNVSIHIRKGAIYGFIGRNGAGKTTIMKMISGLANPTSGSYRMFGQTGVSIRDVRHKVGCLIEAPGIYPELTAVQNLKCRCLEIGQDMSVIPEYLTLVGLGDTGKKKAGKFSLGMKQRLGIAMAMVQAPEFLILDEPINGLDPQGIQEMRHTITRLNQEYGITIMISSHILSELSKVATDYGIIHQGKLLAELTADDLENRGADRIELSVDQIGKAMELVKGWGYPNIRQTSEHEFAIYAKGVNRAELNRALVMEGIGVDELRLHHEDIEEFYMAVTEEGQMTGGADIA